MREPAMCESIAATIRQNGSIGELIDADPTHDCPAKSVSVMDKPHCMTRQKQHSAMPLIPGWSAESFYYPADYPAVTRLETAQVNCFKYYARCENRYS